MGRGAGKIQGGPVSGHSVLQERTVVGRCGWREGRWIHKGANSAHHTDSLLWRYWGATAGFHTEERLGQNFIMIIDLSGNRVDTGEEKDNQGASAA